MGVPRVRDAMPPPHTRASTPRGDCTCPPACLRGGKDTSLSSGMDRAHIACGASSSGSTSIGLRWLAGLVSMQVVVLLRRNPLEIVRTVVGRCLTLPKFETSYIPSYPSTSSHFSPCIFILALFTCSAVLFGNCITFQAKRLFCL